MGTPGPELRAWNEALLEVLLPAGATAEARVLLACDDEAVRAAAARLGLDETCAVASLVRAAAGGEPSVERGLRPGAQAITPFRRAQRPRGVPPFLAALALTVLGASRMDQSEGLSTRAYYRRLCDVLGIEPLEHWPAVTGFKTLVEAGFAALADWLASDCAGSRGLLRVPERPSPRLVGLPISQTLLRGRDRALLTGCFAAHRQLLDAGFDPLLVARRWSALERLTGPAQALLADPDMADLLSAAVSAAYRSWDGGVLDESGVRTWPGLLRLAAQPGRLGVRLAVPSLQADRDASTPDGRSVTLRPYPLDVGLPLDLLDGARDGAMMLRLGNGDQICAIPEATALFAIAAGGLEQVSAAFAGPVWVLTCDPELQRTLADLRRFAAALPRGWELIPDVELAQLPAELRIAGPRERIRGAQLIGGLPLGHGAWLLDFPPRVAADIPEPCLVEIDGLAAGELLAGEEFSLAALAGSVGRHHLDIAGLWKFDIELREAGLRDGTGSLKHHPSVPPLLRAGAVTDERAAPLAYGPVVCGALIDGDEGARWSPPLVTRANATVRAIRRDGRVTLHGPPEPEAWLRQIGLEHAVERWEIPDGDEVVYLCVDSRRSPRVLCLASIEIPMTDAILDCAERMSGAEVVERVTGAVERWQKLVIAARGSSPIV